MSMDIEYVATDHLQKDPVLLQMISNNDEHLHFLEIV